MMNDKTTNVVELHSKPTSDIQTFFHCKKCLEELSEGESPAINQYIDAGWTEKGFQVWCLRHDMNIISIDFEGHKHPAISEKQMMNDKAEKVEDGSELQRTVAAIDELTNEEACTVTIVSGNADFDGPDYIILCKGGWTDWEELTVPGESRIQCLEKAVELKRKA